MMEGGARGRTKGVEPKDRDGSRWQTIKKQQGGGGTWHSHSVGVGGFVLSARLFCNA